MLGDLWVVTVAVEMLRLVRDVRDQRGQMQMCLFVLGLMITLALRYSPKRLIPEVIKREG